MELIKARITNFRSIEDSGEFSISDLNCLVGKNEAGKSAILDALHGIKPYREFAYDKTRDYPRRFLAKFDERHPSGKSCVAETTWKLSQAELDAVNEELGEGVFTGDSVKVSSYIGDANNWTISVNEEKCVEEAITRARLSASELSQVKGIKSTSSFVEKIETLETPSDKLTEISNRFQEFRDNRATLKAIDILGGFIPHFFMTSHFDRMSGEISLTALGKAKAANTVTAGDQIFLDFIEYAGTSIEELENSDRYEALKAQCEGASNDISDEIFEFWSQNDAVSVKIELGEGRAGDPAPFNEGTIAKIRIENSNHRVSIPLSERSAGFVWFFSFLSQFKQLSKTAGEVILLLDEPGLTLHGKAQADLLKYIEERLLPDHQVIFTTHSPFLIPAQKLDKVRVVEDVVTYENGPRRPTIKGTKVSEEILSVDKDTLFPLQGHLGYEVTQSLFIGKNTLLVEGPSDILFLQAASHALKQKDRTHLDSQWTICPSGGIDKVQAFASLFSGNKLNIVVLTDFSKGDKNKLQKLRQSQILESSKILTTSDFLDKDESDIEDFFEPKIYCEIVNEAFGLTDEKAVSPEGISGESTERMVKAMEALFRVIPGDAPDFDHFTPSSYLIKHPEILESDSESIGVTLDRFEILFSKLNDLLA